MSPFLLFAVSSVLATLGFTLWSVKIINQGDQALVERLGKYKKTLKPGVNIILPLIDNIVWEDTTRERVLNVEPQQAITKDNVSLTADAVIYWQILDLAKTHYGVEDIEEAIRNLVVTTLRSAIGRMKLEETYASRAKINQELLEPLDEATGGWGVKVTRVEVRDITPAKNVLEALELERAAESKKRAAIREAEATVESMGMIANALEKKTTNREVMKFLVAQKYVDANFKLGQSKNSKILFMDPNALSEAIGNLLDATPDSAEEDEDDESGSATKIQ